MLLVYQLNRFIMSKVPFLCVLSQVDREEVTHVVSGADETQTA